MAPLPTGFLSLPGPGDTTMRSITRKTRLLALGRLLSHQEVSASLRRPLAHLQACLERIARGAHKQQLIEAMGRIDILAPTLVLESGLAEPDAVLRGLVPNLLLALARGCGGGISESLLWDVPVSALVDERNARVLRFDPPALGILTDPSGVEVRVATGERFTVGDGGEEAPSLAFDEPLHRVADDIWFAEIDSNPIASFEAHPDKTGNAIDLGGRSTADWCDALKEALTLIDLALPELRAEIASTLQRIIGVGYDDERHFSASYREAPGLVCLSLHPSPLTLAEAIVHETQHGKLNALTWLDPVLENGHATWTTSPVRPDMRPLLGVLLALHAFIPVAALHHRLRELGHPAMTGADARCDEVLASNAEGLQTLRELGRPTKLGARVIDALEALHAALR